MNKFIRLAATPLVLATIVALSACSNSPSESDARKIVENTLAECKYFKLRDFQKVNGIPGETGNDYRVDVKYTIRLSPDNDVKANARQWKDQYDKYQSLKADADQKAKQFYDEQQAYIDANPSDPLARQTFEQQHQDAFQTMSNAKIEEGNFAALLNNTTPGLFFRRTIVQVCPGIDLRLLSNFFNGKDTDYSDDVDVEFTQTISMMKTDNGWRADR
ncbi:hypothetical protein [Burkholderia pseudomallei]|uniref:hypothetical protein n=1 Tax=Burkholderia pseudomallei TaxID=28450 RepID=UPI0021F734A8|nr:hypothetical protein [Burkholderia pseudomallei]MCW0080578.1 hypothetical protein [Burkholderia pseudomallei]